MTTSSTGRQSTGCLTVDLERATLGECLCWARATASEGRPPGITTSITASISITALHGVSPKSTLVWHPPAASQHVRMRPGEARITPQGASVTVRVRGRMRRGGGLRLRMAHIVEGWRFLLPTIKGTSHA